MGSVGRLAIFFKGGQALEHNSHVRSGFIIHAGKAFDLHRIGNFYRFIVAVFSFGKFDWLHIESIKCRERGGEFGILNGCIANFFDRVTISQCGIIGRWGLTFFRAGIGLLVSNPPFEIFDGFQ